MQANSPLDGLQRRMDRKVAFLGVGMGVTAAGLAGIATALSVVAGSAVPFWALPAFVLAVAIGAVLVWRVNRFLVRRAMAAFEPFRSRILEARYSRILGYQLRLDNGIIFQSDRMQYTFALQAFYSPGGTLLSPDLRQALRWGMRLRGIREDRTLGYPHNFSEIAREEFRQLGPAFASPLYLSLRERKDVPTDADEPMWYEFLSFGVKPWAAHASEIAGRLDDVAKALDRARSAYGAASAGRA